MAEDRRLIEDYLPIQAISAEASREKSVRKGHISALHLWWARRPLVACRAAVYGALVPATRFTPPNATAAKAKSLGRANAAKFVERLCKYPGDPRIIAEAEQHILEAHAERLSAERGETVTVEDIRAGRAPRPRVLDMFAGGGAIPLEALRLGCEVHALDLNPVAHIIELCTLVYPQKYGKSDPTQPGMTGPKSTEGKPTWGGLAAEVRYWGNWVLERVKAEIGDLYPLIPDPKAEPQDLIEEPQPSLIADDIRQQRLKTAGRYLTPVAYLWTRTVRCKNPNCKAEVPLVKQTWLCKKSGRYVAMRMVAPKDGYRVRFEIVEAATEDEFGFDPESFSKGGNATCPFCKTVADIDYVKSEGMAKRIGQQMMAIACIRPKRKRDAGEKFKKSPGKIYVPVDGHHNLIPDESELKKRIEDICLKANLTPPDEPMPAYGTLGFRVQPYGFLKWSDLYTSRQMICLLAFAAALRESNQELLKAGYQPEQTIALQTCLAVILDRLADFNSTGCTWNYTGGRGVLHTMARQAMPMVWDFAETYPFNTEGASWISSVEDVPAALDSAAKISSSALVLRASATQQPLSNETVDAVITDPPYYDNVPYADISDFFYVWLKRTIGGIYPDHFATELTPKRKEAIAEPMRHSGDKVKANRAYEEMMAQAFAEANRLLKPSGQLTVVYAHKTTLGWSTLVDALRRAGFIVTEAWPLDTERSGRLRAMDSAALATSIFLVARKRLGSIAGLYEEVRPELERIVRERVETLWEMGISGADLVIAAVGAGLRAFTRFASVEYANGEEVPPEKFLAEVEGVVLEMLLEKIFGLSRSGVASVDPASRFYVLWRYAYGARELDAGEAIVFAYPQSVELDGARGLTQGARALVEKKKNKYQLRDFTERGQREELGMPDEERNGAPASLIDVLHRILWLLDHQPRSLPGFLDRAQPDRERLRLVAQALAGPALKGGESATRTVTTTGAETSALGRLLANWRTLIDARLEEFQLK